MISFLILKNDNLQYYFFKKNNITDITKSNTLTIMSFTFQKILTLKVELKDTRR
jgi:hypothetical protein